MCERFADLTVWEARWSQLNHNLDRLAQELAPDSGLSFPRKRTLYSVIRQLHAFAGSHFRFFYAGFNGTGSYRLVESSQYSGAYVLSSILSQVAYDLELIERAIDQRREYSNSDQERATLLEKTDGLAWAALQPAIAAGLIRDDTTVVTYFQKAITVRVMPYAPVALIGLPYTAVTVSRDLLAIPHEVAHYVYRHGSIPGNCQPIKQRLAQGVETAPFFIRNWIEEIFADAYGCLVGGPVMALDFQDLQLASSYDEFVNDFDDEEDPVPLLRPDIYTKVLWAKIQAESEAASESQPHPWQEVVKLLHSHWQMRRRQQLGQMNGESDAGIEFFVQQEVNESPAVWVKNRVRLDQVMCLHPELGEAKPLDKAIRLVVDSVLNPLLLNAHSPWPGSEATLPDIREKGRLEELYDSFDHFYKQAHFPETAEYEAEADQLNGPDGFSQVWRDWVKDKEGFTGDQPIPPGNINPDVWTPLISADGWVTRGPQGNPTGD